VASCLNLSIPKWLAISTCPHILFDLRPFPIHSRVALRANHTIQKRNRLWNAKKNPALVSEFLLQQSQYTRPMVCSMD
jgi:hypothetical protein